MNGTFSTPSDEVEGGLDRLVQGELLRLEQPATLLVQPIQRNCDDLIALTAQSCSSPLRRPTI